MAKSDGTQHVFKEFLVAPADFHKYVQRTQAPDSQELIEARAELYEHILAQLPTLLTPYANDCLIRYFSGEPQLEIAYSYGVTQCAIHNCLYGCVVYTYTPPRRRGGAIPKLRKWVAQDPRCIELLAQIQSLL